MTRIPVKLIASDSGFNFVFLDEAHEDLEGDALEALLDALWDERERLGPGTHVLTVTV